MSEEKPIPAEILDAAAEAVEDLRTQVQLGLCSSMNITEAALRAAGVPDLVARIAELEATNIKLRAEIEMLETENAALEDELSEYWQ